MPPLPPDTHVYAGVLPWIVALVLLLGLVAAVIAGVWLTLQLLKARSEVRELSAGNVRLTASVLEAQAAVVRAVQHNPDSPRRFSRTELGLGQVLGTRVPTPPPATLAPTLASVPVEESWDDATDHTAPFSLEHLRREQEELVPPSKRKHTRPVDPPPLPSRPPPPSEPPDEVDVHSKETQEWRPVSSKTPFG